MFGAEFDFLASLPAIAPEIGLTILAVVVLALDLWLPDSQRKQIALVAGIGMILIGILGFALWSPTPETEGLYWGGMMRHDVLALMFKVMVCIAGGVTALMTMGVKGLGRKGEFYLIVIVSTLGACLISGAADLIMLFLALETMTIPLYVLASFKRDDAKAVEGGMKYFLFGSFASAILLYGLSLLYGFTGQSNLYEIAAYLGSDSFGANPAPVLVALTLIVVGFGFKISAAPFHFWTPDVYEGAPTPVTAYLSVASKAASFALLVRFFLAVFPAGLIVGGQEIQAFWVNLAAVIAVISMTLGNVIALGQKNLKRLLAYSSIAQAGYTLIGIAALGASAAQDIAVAGVAFYMFMYTFTNLLAFVVIVLFGEATGSEEIKDLGGLSRRNPWLAIFMTIALLSLAGVPPAAGFFGKFFLFQAAVEAGLVWLAIIGVLNSIVALYYYLVVIKIMYVDHGSFEERTIPMPRTYVWVMAVTAIIVIVIGSVGVQPIFEWAAAGARALLGSV